MDSFHREIAILRKLNHRNVIKLVDVMEDLEKQKLYLLPCAVMPEDTIHTT